MSYTQLGFGKGLSDLGSLIMQWAGERTRQQREDAAIQRALAQQEKDNTFKQQQLMLQADQAASQRQLNQSTMEQNQGENTSRQISNALSLANNLPGRQVPETLAGELEKNPYTSAFVERKVDPSSITLPGASPVTDMEGAVIPSLSPRSLPPTFVPTESEKYRIAGMNAANRTQIQMMRDNMLQAKMMQDKELAKMVNALGWERVKVMAEGIRGRLGLGYDTLDQAFNEAQADRDNSVIVAHMRAMASQGALNPMFAALGITPPEQKNITKPESAKAPPPTRKGAPAGSGNTTSPPAASGGRDPKLDAILQQRRQP